MWLFLLCRGNYAFGTPSFGPNFLEPVRYILVPIFLVAFNNVIFPNIKLTFQFPWFTFRPPPNLGNSAGGQILPNVSYRPQHIFNNSHPQVFSNWGNQEAATPIIQQLHCSQQQSSSQLSQLSLQQIQIPRQNSQLSQQAVSDMQKQLHLRQSSTQNVEQQQNSHVIVSESEVLWYLMLV